MSPAEGRVGGGAECTHVATARNMEGAWVYMYIYIHIYISAGSENSIPEFQWSTEGELRTVDDVYIFIDF
jgi:hypothetical protein